MLKYELKNDENHRTKENLMTIMNEEIKFRLIEKKKIVKKELIAYFR
jgi:hypothetical protein